MTCCKLSAPGIRFIENDTEAVLTDAHAATNSATSAAKTIVLAKTSAKSTVAADVPDAAFCGFDVE